MVFSRKALASGPGNAELLFTLRPLGKNWRQAKKGFAWQLIQGEI
jgi:hypothetical protein